MKWFEDSLAFYASYHHNEVNKLVHIVFVWPIFWTAQVMLCYAGDVPLSSSMGVSWTLLVSLAYALYYFFIEQPGIAGPLASALVAAGFFVSRSLVSSFPSVWVSALALHLLAWVAQIYAHQVHEKRAPAFLDNVVQALVMAPLFVLIEVLFMIGYKPELQRRINSVAEKNIAEFRQSQRKTM